MPVTCTLHSSPTASREFGLPGAEDGTSPLALADVTLLPGALSALHLRGLDLSGHLGGGIAVARALSDLIARVPLLLLDLKNCHINDRARRGLGIVELERVGVTSKK